MWSSNTVREANSGHSSDQELEGNLEPTGEIRGTDRILLMKAEGKGPL